MSWLKKSSNLLALGVTSKRYDDNLLALEPVLASDLLPSRDQAWLDALRAGAITNALQSLEVEVHPGENEEADRLNGYVVEMRNGRQNYRRHFKPSTLSQTLARPLEKLLKDEVLQADDEYDYHLTSRPSDELDHTPALGHIQAKQKVEPPHFQTASLAKYIENSEEVIGPTSKQLAAQERESSQLPIFFQPGVWEEGHELARLGGEDESAAVATGRLMRDSDSSEIFVSIDAFLQAEFAAEEKYSVTFSGDTWAQVQERLEQRRKRLNQPHEIIVGSVHGHNFSIEPDESGRMTCDACSVLEVCSRSTAVASTDDFSWHRSVFAGQPWASLLIWGFNARSEEEWRMYGLENATLMPRTVRMLTEEMD